VTSGNATLTIAGLQISRPASRSSRSRSFGATLIVVRAADAVEAVAVEVFQQCECSRQLETPQGVPVLGKGLLQRSRMTIVDPAAVTRLTGFDSVRELRRDRIGLTRIAAGAHIENDVRHRLQEMLAMLARRLA
jgi:hypothetical protein